MIPSKMYRVTITDGELDNLKIGEYEDFDVSALTVADKESCLDKALAYSRFYQMCLAINSGLDFMGDFDNNRKDGAWNIVPASLSFTVSYTQADGLYVYVDEEDDDYVEDGENVKKLRNGKVIFTGKKALEKLIKNALTNAFKVFVEYYDCTEIKTPSGQELKGWTIETMEIPSVNPTIEIKELLPYEA